MVRWFVSTMEGWVPAQVTANEYCSALHIIRRCPYIMDEICNLLGFAERDLKWVTPEGRDVSGLCDRSLNGGLSAYRWSIDGWELDEDSMIQLRNEFPTLFREGSILMTRKPILFGTAYTR